MSSNDLSLQSFVPVPPTSHFPIQNLPYGAFLRRGDPSPHLGVAIGEFALDLTVLEQQGRLQVPALADRQVFQSSTLNTLMAEEPAVWHEVRGAIRHLLQADVATLRDDAELRSQVLVPLCDLEMQLPVAIGDYTDFYSSREHATNVGSLFRDPQQALLPNWLHLPVAYHGRSSSIVISGTDLRRPYGQTRVPGSEAPVFGPSQRVDFELEMGWLVGTGNRLGEPVPIDRALSRMFGMVLVNDWSARDIQQWEYVPLGPFLSKSFGTSISPWVVTAEALEPFAVEGPTQHLVPLPYLQASRNLTYDIHLEVELQDQPEGPPTRLCDSNYRYLYWSIEQQVAHHTINGCNLRTGDLLASGTISGPSADARGSLLELTLNGRQPLTLASGQTRRFLEDGDEVVMTGYCVGNGYRVGFGEVRGRLLPAARS